ncbi:hypothetical protein BDV96DRAFT_584364 [Lophiotrema nucula]|uniref:Uncharacterized protein n=1 Tax=Lophiotrema nucula TaxID=690887 RepID=A0A6A5YSX2_9PLEO|nr:hypothetical protein BDV96DRAFT_584364 [Lophiotrema nucula]
MDPILSSCVPIPDPGLNCSTSELGSDFCPGVGCTNFYTDRLNCGSCNNTCDWRCSYGSCICPRDLSRRQDRKSCCDPGWSINFDTNRCEASCPDGWFFDFELGECRPVDGTELPTSTLTIISSSTMIVTNITSAGTVTTTTIASPSPATDICPEDVPWLCFGECVNVYDDLNNCGMCGNVCEYGCSLGECACLVGQHMNADNKCVNDTIPEPSTTVSRYVSISSTSTDGVSTPIPTACPEEFPNLCLSICEDLPPDECIGNCVDLLSDISNCGTCGSVCAGNLTCQSGECAKPVGSFILAGLGG